jgi:predicted DsbA family dithiol-disulfide isomerase
MTDVTAAPGTVVVYSDIGCPWAHLAVHRLLRARAALGLDGSVTLDHRVFALEVVNRQPTPKLVLDAETVVVGSLDPSAGWQLWQERGHRYPVTILPAMEAVQAAKEQDLAASEQLDRALRVAFFAESRCVSLRSVILDVAESCGQVDAGTLAEAIDDGRARRSVMDQHEVAMSATVAGSPHVFLPDGTDAHNPGICMRWEGRKGEGFPVVSSDDRSVYEDLLRRAAAA